MKQNTLYRSILSAAVAAAVAMPAYSALELEEVVVTARKKEESIQDTPVAVTAIAGSDIEQAFTLDTTGLQAFAPNVVFDTIEMGTPGGGGFSIRGISYQDVDKGFDPTVLVSVDDVPLATGTGQVFDMIDIERIEVLRGPQGTLFGKNVVGGLINIHRVKPILEETSGKVRLRYGEYEKSQGDFLLNYGEEDWALKLTGGVSRQDEGYIDNRNGGDLWYRDSERFGAHMLWQPNDVLTAETMIDYSNLEGSPGAVFLTDIDTKDTFCALTTAFGTPLCSGSPGEPASGDRDETYADAPQWNQLEKWQGTVRLTADVTDDHTLTYVGSLMKSDDDQALDGDATPYEIYHFRRWGEFEQFSHELRLSRNTGSIFTWQVGLFQASTEGTTFQDSTLNQLIGLPAGSGPTTYEETITKSDSYSVFGEGDIALLDEQLVITVGARYINEKKSVAKGISNYLTGLQELGPNAGGNTEDSDVIYRLGARYHFNDDVMAYFTTSTGFRSGGLSPRAQTQEVLAKAYEPEKLKNFELGLRTTMLDGSLILNLTAFSMEYTNMQIELAVAADQGTGTQIEMANVGKATIEGLELDFNWLINDWWRISGNVGILDAEYDSLFGNIWGSNPVTGEVYDERDETGLEMRRAPELSYGLSSTMSWDFAGGALTWRTSYSWTDEYEATITNYYGTNVEETGIVDSSISFDTETWQLSLYGRNLTDEDSWTHNYVVNPVRPTADDVAPGTFWRFAQRRPPREIGAEFLYKF